MSPASRPCGARPPAGALWAASLWTALAAAAAAAPSAGSASPSGVEGELARVHTAQLPRTYSAASAAVGDVDGDGREDLVVSAVERSSPRARALFLFVARADGELGAARALELPLDVTAWALGDVHADPGVELVLFSARGAFLMRPDAPEEQRFALLAAADFLWQLPDGDAAFQWQDGLVDLDGDGRLDLLMPEPGGYALALRRAQERPPQAGGEARDGDDGGTAGFAPLARVRIPYDATPAGSYLSSTGWRGERSDAQLGLSRSVSAGVSDDFQLPSLLLTVSESVPAPQLIDWDGDRDLDLLAQTRTGLHVFPQEAGAFGTRLSYPLPVEADRDRRLDASYSSHAVDLNGDSRADCVIFAGDRQKSDVRTQALVFVQGAGRGDAAQTPEAPLFGPRGRPQDLLVFAGFVLRPDFVDIDGDGQLDLAISGVRPDLIDQLRSISSESIDTDLFVYRGRGTGFSRQPDLAYTLAVPLEQFEPTARFFGDLTGDGISELLLRDEPERLRVLMVRSPRGGGQLTVVERPLWELRVDEEARVRLQAMPGRPLPDLLVIARMQVQHVRFR